MRDTSRSSRALSRQLVIVGSLHLSAQRLTPRPPSATIATVTDLSIAVNVRPVDFVTLTMRLVVSKLALVRYLVFDELSGLPCGCVCDCLSIRVTAYLLASL